MSAQTTRNGRETTVQVELSVIAPMFNEAENVAETARRIREAMADFDKPWELIIVDDGSTDGSRQAAKREAASDRRIRVVGYRDHVGRGRALREGFAAARGRFVVTIDFDLSYDPGHILRLYEALGGEDAPDIVLASAYMPGGTVEGVSWRRLLPSKLGNWLLRLAWPRRIYTSTCIVRGYRREALERLDLAGDDKEIHLEVLEQAFERGMRVVEIPARLRSRSRGKAKLAFPRTTLTHLAFLARRRPWFFAAFGLVVVAAIVAAAILLW